MNFFIVIQMFEPSFFFFIQVFKIIKKIDIREYRSDSHRQYAIDPPMFQSHVRIHYVAKIRWARVRCNCETVRRRFRENWHGVIIKVRRRSRSSRDTLKFI